MSRFIIAFVFFMLILIMGTSLYVLYWHSEFEYQTYKITCLQIEIKKHKARLVYLEARPPIMVKSATIFTTKDNITIQDNHLARR